MTRCAANRDSTSSVSCRISGHIWCIASSSPCLFFLTAAAVATRRSGATFLKCKQRSWARMGIGDGGPRLDGGSATPICLDGKKRRHFFSRCALSLLFPMFCRCTFSLFLLNCRFVALVRSFSAPLCLFRSIRGPPDRLRAGRRPSRRFRATPRADAARKRAGRRLVELPLHFTSLLSSSRATHTPRGGRRGRFSGIRGCGAPAVAVAAASAARCRDAGAAGAAQR